MSVGEIIVYQKQKKYAPIRLSFKVVHKFVEGFDKRSEVQSLRAAFYGTYITLKPEVVKALQSHVEQGWSLSVAMAKIGMTGRWLGLIGRVTNPEIMEIRSKAFDRNRLNSSRRGVYDSLD